MIFWEEEFGIHNDFSLPNLADNCEVLRDMPILGKFSDFIFEILSTWSIRLLTVFTWIDRTKLNFITNLFFV